VKGDAEKMSEAFVEDNFKKYVRYQLVYNAAVLLVLIVLARVLDHYCRAPIGYLVVASVVLCWFPFWGCDTIFLVCGGLREGPEYKKWRQTLQGQKKKFVTPCGRAHAWVLSVIRGAVGR
jgi:hypothetical protein